MVCADGLNHGYGLEGPQGPVPLQSHQCEGKCGGFLGTCGSHPGVF